MAAQSGVKHMGAKRLTDLLGQGGSLHPASRKTVQINHRPGPATLLGSIPNNALGATRAKVGEGGLTGA